MQPPLLPSPSASTSPFSTHFLPPHPDPSVEEKSLYEQDPAGTVQALVDHLVEAVENDDILLVAWYLLELRSAGEERAVKGEHSKTGLSALPLAALSDSAESRFIIQLLLLSGAQLDACLVGNQYGEQVITDWARDTWELWELEAVTHVEKAHELLTIDGAELENWLGENMHACLTEVCPGPDDPAVFRPNPVAIQNKKRKEERAPRRNQRGRGRKKRPAAPRSRGATHPPVAYPDKDEASGVYPLANEVKSVEQSGMKGTDPQGRRVTKSVRVTRSTTAGTDDKGKKAALESVAEIADQPLGSTTPYSPTSLHSVSTSPTLNSSISPFNSLPPPSLTNPSDVALVQSLDLTHRDLSHIAHAEAIKREVSAKQYETIVRMLKA
ncbi:hypothetical protein JCM11641_003296 [Rhodosporidiobolus odoratus]